MSETPLTDAAEKKQEDAAEYIAHLVPASFARTLETTAETLRARVAELERERDALAEKVSTIKRAAMEAVGGCETWPDVLSNGPKLRSQLERWRESSNELSSVLTAVWSRVLEMKKDARTDYTLPELAALDLKSIVSQHAKVGPALMRFHALSGESETRTQEETR